MRDRRRLDLGNASGFSLLELFIVVAIMGLVMAIAVPSVRTEITDARANAAMWQVQSQLQTARDWAMTQRRTMEVQFNGTNQIQVIRISGTVRTTLATLVFPNSMQYQLFDGIPDTPDTFGATRPISFGGQTTVWFLADGSLSDANNVPVSGTVFLGIPNQRLTPRAVTVLGPTGRIQSYRWDGSAWR
jgi:prepilin-type N-terminal cleavage/methylation domain-containing protein